MLLLHPLQQDHGVGHRIGDGRIDPLHSPRCLAPGADGAFALAAGEAVLLDDRLQQARPLAGPGEDLG